MRRLPSSGRAAWAAGVAGLALTGAYFVLPAGAAQALLYSGIGCAAAIALVLGARRGLPLPARAPWLLLAAGVASFAAGDALFAHYELTGQSPYPSLADVAYLAAYPLLFAGVLLLAVRVRGTHLRFALADAFIVAGALAILQWVWVMEPLAREDSGLAGLSLLAYPAVDILLAAALARLIFTPAWRLPAFQLLAFAVLLQLVADEIYLFVADTYVSGSWLDSLWLLSYVLFAAAGLHPSVRRLARTQPADGATLGWARVLVLGGALVAIPGALASRDVAGVDLVVVAVGSAALSILVLVRIVALVRTLTAQNEELRDLDRLKDEFLGLVSHDLRTPLTAISGYVELLLDDDERPLGDQQRRFLDVVGRNVRRLQRLVDDLLFVARIQAGWRELELGEVDVAELARRCVEDSGPRADGVALSLEVRDAPTAVGDASRLSQLLDNLVSNALKFTPDGGAVVVTVTRGAGGLVLEVADSGIGIAAEDQVQLFERFYRAPNARGQIPGTGLGLHIARAIVEAHGGSISVRSRLGAGTTFRVELPLSPPEADNGSRIPARSRSAPVPAPGGRASAAGS